MNDTYRDDEKIASILEKLNWWVEQTYNPQTGEIESTGEAQAAIKNYLDRLDNLNVPYTFENRKYVLSYRN